MIEYFGDTSYYLAVISPRDLSHSIALDISRTFNGRIVTTAWVVQEVADGLAHRSRREFAFRFLSSLESDPLSLVIGPDKGLWHKGLVLFQSRADKDWSLTDCLSFVVMRERGVTQALTADRHFEQAGFTALLRTFS